MYIYVCTALTRGLGGGQVLNTVREAQKEREAKTSSGPREGLQQEREECGVLCDCAGFSSDCFAGVIVLKSPETLS